jgi:hypothetical protein
VVGGVSFSLTTPSAQQSGLKLNIQQDIVNGVLYKLLLDFDAAKSVVQTGNGKFILKPVIRTILDAQGGSIAGVVRPETFVSAILAIKGTDTVASSFTASNGNFLIKGLAAGTYAVACLPSDTSYKKQTRTDIIVTTGAVTKLDTLQLTR